LYTRTSIEDLFSTTDRVLIYQLAAENRKTDWFPELQDIFESKEYQEMLQFVADTNCSYVAIKEAVLHKQQLFPVVPSKESPYEAVVHNEGNRLVVFANLNPDEVGSHKNRGKVLFPDKSCADKICAGKVRITRVKHKENYGFFIGKMVSCETPSEEILAEWILNELNTGSILNSVIQFIKNPLWGDAIRIRNTSTSVESYCTKDSDGKVTMNNLLDMYDHSKDEIVEEISVEDFICSGYTGAAKDELCGIVPYINSHPGWDKSQISPAFISDDFDIAVNCGLITLLKLHSILYCRINPDRMYRAASILRNDLTPVLEKAAEINQTAIERFAARRRKGKI